MAVLICCCADKLLFLPVLTFMLQRMQGRLLHPCCVSSNDSFFLQSQHLPTQESFLESRVISFACLRRTLWLQKEPMKCTCGLSVILS